MTATAVRRMATSRQRVAPCRLRALEKGGGQPNFAGAEQQQKRLAIFLDGTWNSIDSNTNVWRMLALCAAKSKYTINPSETRRTPRCIIGLARSQGP
jgi:hypothetical protein